MQSLSGKASVENHSPVAKKIISLEKHEAARDSSVTNYLLHKVLSLILTSVVAPFYLQLTHLFRTRVLFSKLLLELAFPPTWFTV